MPETFKHFIMHQRCLVAITNQIRHVICSTNRLKVVRLATKFTSLRQHLRLLQS